MGDFFVTIFQNMFTFLGQAQNILTMQFGIGDLSFSLLGLFSVTGITALLIFYGVKGLL